MKLWIKNSILLLAVVAITIIPLFVLKDAQFLGADNLGRDAILEIQPEYEPWFQPLMEPKSSEIETLLFVVQASIGAGVIGFVLGKKVLKSKKVSGNK